jgi:adenylate kinase
VERCRHLVLASPPHVTSRLAQDMMRHAQYSTTASIYQHVATEDMFAAAQAAQDWIEKANAA